MGPFKHKGILYYFLINANFVIVFSLFSVKMIKVLLETNKFRGSSAVERSPVSDVRGIIYLCIPKRKE